MTLSKEHRANIEAAIKETEYKYFGMYEFTEAQYDAVDLLVSVAQAVLDDDAQSASIADTAGAKPIYQVRPRNGEEWTDVSENEYRIIGGAGYLQRIVYAAPPAPSVADAAGFESIRVKNFLPFVEAVERAIDKGYMPDAMVDSWGAFEFTTEPVADAAGASEDARDAKRYRWLRDEGDAQWAIVKCHAGEYLDAAIDTALAQEDGK